MVVLIIAGLDPSGGAGLVADAATVVRRGFHPAAVATGWTIQDSAHCAGWDPVSPELVAKQLSLLVEDLPIRAIKIGMVGSTAMAQALAQAIGPLCERAVPMVLDPVLHASIGSGLYGGDPKALSPLLHRAMLVTPNRDEAERLTGIRVSDCASQEAAARALVAAGAGGALVKGGHLAGPESVDLLFDGRETVLFRMPRRSGITPHGTGCALSSEIACALAAGETLHSAVATAHARVAARIAAATPLGRGRSFC